MEVEFVSYSSFLPYRYVKGENALDSGLSVRYATITSNVHSIHPLRWMWVEKSRSIRMMHHHQSVQLLTWCGLKQTNSNIAGASERCIIIRESSRWAG